MQLVTAMEGYLLHKSTRAAKTTLTTDRFLLKQFADYMGVVAVEAISTQDIINYMAVLKQRLAPHTVHRHYAILSAFWTWLTDSEIALVDTNIIRAVPAPKLPQKRIETLNRKDIKALIAACETSRNKRRDKALLLFLLDSGCRVSEIASLQLDDLNLKTGKAKVTGKGNKERFIYVGNRTKQALWLYIQQERPTPLKTDSNHVFLTHEGYPTNRDILRHTVYRIGKRANVKAYPHLFRHSAAIERLRRGMDLETLRVFLGHEKLSTTQKYLTALQDEDVRAKAMRTSPCDDWRL